MLCICVSCSDFDKEEQKNRVESLSKEISAIEQNFLEIRIDSISTLKNSTYEVERRIKQNYIVETIDLDFGKKMDDFKRMRKMLGPLGKTDSRLRKSIEEEKEQLVKLTSDISDGFGKRESYNEYIDFEKNKVTQIKVFYKEYVEIRAQFLKLYNTLYQELYNVSITLNSE